MNKRDIITDKSKKNAKSNNIRIRKHTFLSNIEFDSTNDSDKNKTGWKN